MDNADYLRKEFKVAISTAEQPLLDTASDTHHAWLGLLAMWKDEWWTRTWIYQEATIPEDRLNRYVGFKPLQLKEFPEIHTIYFLLGHEATTWKKMETTLMAAGSLRTLPEMKEFFSEDPLKLPNQLLKLRRERVVHYAMLSNELARPNALSILNVLQNIRHSNCYDPRDKVYAPLCLSPEGFSQGIVLDYRTRSVLNVYMDVVKSRMLQPTNKLDFLGYAMWTPQPLRSFPIEFGDGQFPSWLPNWFEPLEDPSLPKYLFVPRGPKKLMKRLLDAFNPYHFPSTEEVRNVSMIRTFNASCSRAGSARILNEELHVDAIFFDSIEEIVPIDRKTFPGESGLIMDKWIQGSANKYPSGGTLSDAFNRTLVLDLKFDDFRRPLERGGTHDAVAHHRAAEELTPTELGERSRMLAAVFTASRQRNICLTKSGYLAMVPSSAVVGDKVFAFLGGDVFYTLRHREHGAHKFLYIGEAYVHGLMHGEWMNHSDRGEREAQNVVLI